MALDRRRQHRRHLRGRGPRIRGAGAAAPAGGGRRRRGIGGSRQGRRRGARKMALGERALDPRSRSLHRRPGRQGHPRAAPLRRAPRGACEFFTGNPMGERAAARISGRRAPRRRSSVADGSAYTVLLVPRRPSIFGALSLPGISFMILCIALVVSALTSWWLAQHLSAPIRRIQAGARALAGENSMAAAPGDARERGTRGAQGRARRARPGLRCHGGPADRQPRAR